MAVLRTSADTWPQRCQGALRIVGQPLRKEPSAFRVIPTQTFEVLVRRRKRDGLGSVAVGWGSQTTTTTDTTATASKVTFNQPRRVLSPHRVRIKRPLSTVCTGGCSPKQKEIDDSTGCSYHWRPHRHRPRYCCGIRRQRRQCGRVRPA